MRLNRAAHHWVQTALSPLICGALLLWSLSGCSSAPVWVSDDSAGAYEDGARSAADAQDAYPDAVETSAAPAVPAAPTMPAREPDAEQARELVRLATTRLSGVVAVRREADRGEADRYLAAVSDVNGNGRLNIAVVALDDQFADHADPGVMADSSRLYRGDARTPPVYLALFEHVGRDPAMPGAVDHLREIHRFSMGRRRVVGDLVVRPIHVSQPLPAAFVLTIVTREGREDYWCALTANDRPTMAIAETAAAVRTVVSDIEGNGYLDLLRHQQVFEAGRGYDTLISWTRWTEDGFADSGTTNVVRNLTRFLDWAERTLVRGAWAEFADYGLRPTDRRSLMQAGFSPAEVVDAVFVAENGVALTEVARQDRIAEVVFPEIGRNPFPEPGRQTSFRTSLRAITEAHVGYFFQTEIAMQLNPFQPQQFFFRPAEIRPADTQGE